MIGETIMRGLLTDNTEETDLTYEKPVESLILEKTITVIVVPVYGGRVAETALERMEMIHGNQSPAVPVVVYGNRDYEDALRELRDWCFIHGFTPVAGAAFVGEHSFSRPDKPIAANRPDVRDLQAALNFGEEIRMRLSRMKSLYRIKELAVKGNYPYKVKGPKTLLTPLTASDRCSQCGFCIEICPVKAIRLVNEVVSKPEICIKCCACVKQCPNGARMFDTPFTDYLFENFSARKKPELFFLD